MFSSSLLFNSSTLVFLILISNIYSAKPQDGGSNYGDGSSIVPPPSPPTDQSACNNCTICQYPNCHPQPPPTPPPSAGDQPYAAPPPPSSGQVNCPPAAPVTCCGGVGGGQYYPPPSPFYYPYNNNYSGAAAPMRSPLAKPGSYVSTWPPVLFCIIFCYSFFTREC